MKSHRSTYRFESTFTRPTIEFCNVSWISSSAPLVLYANIYYIEKHTNMWEMCWRSRDINTSDLSFVQFIYSTIQRVSSLFPSFKFVNFADFIHYFDSLLRTKNAASSYLHWIVSNEWTGQSPLFYFTFSSIVEFIDFFPVCLHTDHFFSFLFHSFNIITIALKPYPIYVLQ